MANTIYITRTASGVAPSSIDVGQLILDTASGYVYTKRDDNALVLINNGIPGPVGPSGAPGADGSSIISDGSRGDITVSSSGAIWVVNSGAISTSKLGGDVTPAGKALLDDANASAQRTTLGLGSAAVLNVGTGAGNVVQLDGSGKLPAVDGSQLTNLPGGGVTDGNKGDITVSGTLWTINNGVVETVNLGGDITTAGKALLDDADAAVQRATLGLAAVASTGDYSDLTGTPVIPSGTNAVAQPLGVAAAGTSNDYARGDHIHALPTVQTIGADPSGTASAAISGHVAAANPHPVYPLASSLGAAAYRNLGTVSGTVASGDDSRFTTNLSYTAATRVLSSSTGSSAILPLFTSTQAGLTPQSGGGTTNFLRADGTWAAPAGGGGGTVISPGYQTFANGSLIAPPCCRNGTGNSNSVAPGRAFFWQLYIPAAQTFTQILCRTQSNYAGTSDIVLGIYDHNSSINRPNAKIYDSGTFQITASGAANYGPGPISVTLQPGFYWLAFLSISAATTPSFAAPNVASNGALGYPWYAEVTTGGAAVFTLLANGLSSLPATAPTLAVNSSAAGALVFLGV